ncbi:hypothetical protein ASH00_16150 [Arthrobacter sp. Soil782]|nr:hypothetical protein ASH00_16150 [Arthrobacter sp. Soil782]
MSVLSDLLNDSNVEQLSARRITAIAAAKDVKVSNTSISKYLRAVLHRTSWRGCVTAPHTNQCDQFSAPPAARNTCWRTVRQHLARGGSCGAFRG